MSSAWFSDVDADSPFQILADGDYEIQLGHYREETRGAYDCLIFPFSVNGKSNIVPHEISLLSPRDPEDKAGRERSRRILREFYTCFGVSPKSKSVTPDDFFMLKGNVKIGVNLRGYKTVEFFYPKKKCTIYDHSGKVGAQPDPTDYTNVNF